MHCCSTSYRVKHGGEDWLNAQLITRCEFLSVVSIKQCSYLTVQEHRDLILLYWLLRRNLSFGLTTYPVLYSDWVLWTHHRLYPYCILIRCWDISVMWCGQYYTLIVWHESKNKIDESDWSCNVDIKYELIGKRPTFLTAARIVCL